MSQDPSVIAGGRFRVQARLGSGATATVYRCLDTALNVERAVKLFKLETSARSDLRHRLLTEARLLASMHHPNIVRVVDIGRDGQQDYIVSELVDGPSLYGLVKSHGPLRSADAVTVATGLLGGLAYVHERGVVHRDIKPQNVLVGRDQQARLIDFGIAIAPDLPRITQMNVMMGTPDFMSPEQRNDAKNASVEADIYAVGATLFWALTGLETSGLCYSPPDSMRWAAVPAELRPVLQRATQREAAERYRNAGQMRTALVEALRAAAPEQGDRERFVRTMVEARTDLLQARKSGDANRCRQIARHLAVLGDGAGFPDVAGVAEALAEAPDTRVVERFDRLIEVLQRQVKSLATEERARKAPPKAEPTKAKIVVVEDDLSQAALLRRRMPDAGCRMPDAGCRMPDAGCRMPDAGCRMPDAGCRMPDAGCRMPDAGCRMPDAGPPLAGVEGGRSAPLSGMGEARHRLRWRDEGKAQRFSHNCRHGGGWNRPGGCLAYKS